MLVFAPIVDGEEKVVVVIVVRAPGDGLVALFAETLRRLIELCRRGGLRDEDAGRIRRRRNFQDDAGSLAGRQDCTGLRANAGILKDDGVDNRSDVAREIREADPVNAVAWAAIVNDSFPLEEASARRFGGRAGFRIRSEPAGPFSAGIFGVAGADEKFEARLTRGFF